MQLQPLEAIFQQQMLPFRAESELRKAGPRKLPVSPVRLTQSISPIPMLPISRSSARRQTANSTCPGGFAL